MLIYNISCNTILWKKWSKMDLISNRFFFFTQFSVVLFLFFHREHCERLLQNTIKVPLQQCCIMRMNAAGDDPGVQTQRVLRLWKKKEKKKPTVDFYICLASLLCKELGATFLCSHLGAEHIGCATALTDYCPKLWRPCLPAGGTPASNSCPLAFKMLSSLLTKTEREWASSALLELFVIFVIFTYFIWFVSICYSSSLTIIFSIIWGNSYSWVKALVQ